ncbi:hypothetical protein T484DRAFT_1762911 [Baffinella frigidus]|nr:hypothetical protein T484DRAFT_1762911 [Cryptophyta sp. CCMP2293]
MVSEKKGFISGPLVALRSGRVEARNRNLWPYNFLVDCFFFQTLWYTTVILVIIYREILPAWFLYETVSFVLFPIGRAAIVSTKYAFYGDIQLGDDVKISASLRSEAYYSSGQRLKNQMVLS